MPTQRPYSWKKILQQHPEYGIDRCIFSKDNAIDFADLAANAHLFLRDTSQVTELLHSGVGGTERTPWSELGTQCDIRSCLSVLGPLE